MNAQVVGADLAALRSWRKRGQVRAYSMPLTITRATQIQNPLSN